MKHPVYKVKLIKTNVNNHGFPPLQCLSYIYQHTIVMHTQQIQSLIGARTNADWENFKTNYILIMT